MSAAAPPAADTALAAPPTASCAAVVADWSADATFCASASPASAAAARARPRADAAAACRPAEGGGGAASSAGGGDDAMKILVARLVLWSAWEGEGGEGVEVSGARRVQSAPRGVGADCISRQQLEVCRAGQS